MRTHGVVTKGGEAPNVIPAHTEGRWYIRAETLAQLAEIEPRVQQCFEAGALATGCDVTVELEGPRYAELRTDEGLIDRYAKRIGTLGHALYDDDSRAAMSRASTDMGNVSQVLPVIHPYFGIGSWPAVNHQPEFAAATITATAEAAMLDTATALAHTLIDAATQPTLRSHLTDGGSSAA